MPPDALVVWNYTVKADHRDGSFTKSQWGITIPQEKRAFKTAISKGWEEVGSGRAWGLHFVDDEPAYLGFLAADSSAPNASSFIAIFDLSANTHGYPADYRATREKPPSAVRSDWVDKSIISKAKASKIGQGKRCAL